MIGIVAESVDPRTAAEMMRAGDVIVDVRTPGEYATGHVSGAINLPIDTLALADLPDGQLITTCSMGGRAGRAAELLDAMGRTAFSMRGGTTMWHNHGLPVVRGREPGPRLR